MSQHSEHVFGTVELSISLSDKSHALFLMLSECRVLLDVIFTHATYPGLLLILVFNN